MTERELEVSRIVEISEAVAIAGDNKHLDGTVSYRVGRLGDFCKLIVRSYTKQRDRLIREAREKERILREKYKNGSPEEKVKANEEIVDISEKLTDALDSLATQVEKIRVPELKLSEFIAKNDITEIIIKDGVSDAKIIAKTGQSLLPIRFFTLMGDVVVDDKKTGVDE
jgi:hypothetical protein